MFDLFKTPVEDYTQKQAMNYILARERQDANVLHQFRVYKEKWKVHINLSGRTVFTLPNGVKVMLDDSLGEISDGQRVFAELQHPKDKYLYRFETADQFIAYILAKFF